jgi:hypothetical protein
MITHDVNHMREVFAASSKEFQETISLGTRQDTVCNFKIFGCADVTRQHKHVSLIIIV